MTTIATDGRSMAGDGRTTCGNTIVSETTAKVIRLDDGRIVGACGEAQSRAPFIEWLVNGGDKPKLDKHFSALILHPCGRVEGCDHACAPYELPTPQAIGSGMDFALAFMDAGMDPHQAVTATAKRDTGTGGEIVCLERTIRIQEAA